jgi:AcrR family transcriptional regulator
MVLSREELIDKLVEVVYEVGYDGATLSVISEATGLGRASLYHHFPGGKEQMLNAVLEQSDRWGSQRVGHLLASEQSAEEKVRGLFAALDEVHTHAHQLTLMNLFTYGGARQVFGPRIGERAKAGLDALTTLLEECGLASDAARQKALDAYIQIEGAMVLSRTLNDLDVFRRVVRRLPDELLAH